MNDITRINELAHNQAMLTLMNERQELLRGRARLAEMAQALQAAATSLKELNEEVTKLKEELAEARKHIEDLENAAVERSE